MIGYQPSPYLQVCHAAALGSHTDHAGSFANTADRLTATASLMPHFSFISLETRIRYCCQKRGPYTIDTSAIRLLSSCYISTLSALSSSACLSLLHTTAVIARTLLLQPLKSTRHHIKPGRRLPQTFLFHHKLSGRDFGDSLTSNNSSLTSCQRRLDSSGPNERAHRRFRTLQRQSHRHSFIHGFPEHSLITKPAHLIKRYRFLPKHISHLITDSQFVLNIALSSSQHKLYPPCPLRIHRVLAEFP